MNHIKSCLAVAALLAIPAPAAAEESVCVNGKAGPFEVLFAQGSDALTPRAKSVLDKAARAFMTCSPYVLMLSGHTDRSGSESDNTIISQKVTVAVRDYLASRGIPVDVMTMEAFGESSPKVVTADGVVEPKNRRVEIVWGPGRWDD